MMGLTLSDENATVVHVDSPWPEGCISDNASVAMGFGNSGSDAKLHTAQLMRTMNNNRFRTVPRSFSMHPS